MNIHTRFLQISAAIICILAASCETFPKDRTQAVVNTANSYIGKSYMEAVFDLGKPHSQELKDDSGIISFIVDYKEGANVASVILGAAAASVKGRNDGLAGRESSPSNDDDTPINFSYYLVTFWVEKSKITRFNIKTMSGRR